MLSLGCVRALGADAPALTVQDAWARVRAANEALLAAQSVRAQKGAEKDATRSLLLPSVDLVSTYTHLDAPIAIDLDPLRQLLLQLMPTVPPAAVPALRLPVQDERFVRSTLNLTWPVYAGGRIDAARRAAAAGVAEADAAFRQTEQMLFSELVRRYYGTQLAVFVAATRAEVLTAMEEHVRQATRLEQEGFITRAESLHATVARDKALRDRQQADRQVEIIRIALAGLLAADAPAAPSSPLFVLSTPLESVSSFVAAGDSSQPALAGLEAKRAQAAEGVAAQQGTLHPEVFLFGRQELVREDLTVLDPKWAVGVGVRVNLFDRSDRLSQLKAARATARRVDYLLADARRGVHTLIEQQHREVSSAREQFASLDTALALARESLHVRQASFREGLATSLEVVDAQLALAGVETERAAAAYAYAVALARLLEATGQPDRFFIYLASPNLVTVSP